MRKQIVPRVLVIALSTLAFQPAFADDTSALPDVEESSRSSGTTTRGAAAQQGPTNTPDAGAQQAAVEKAADLCDDTADEAASNCSDQGISPGKVSGEGLGSSDQSASLTRMTKDIQKRIESCSPYAGRCKAQCARLSSQMHDQCPTCNFASLSSASNKCSAANKRLANLRAQKDSFVADNQRTKEHGKLTGEAGEDVTGRRPRVADQDPTTTGSVTPDSRRHVADLDPTTTGSVTPKDPTRTTGRDDTSPARRPSSASERPDTTPSTTHVAARNRDADHNGIPDRLDRDRNGIPDKLDKNGDGTLDSKQMKTASVTPNKEPAQLERPDDQKPNAQPNTQSPTTDDGKAERRAARRAARQQNEMQQQMQASMMQQSLQQMAARAQTPVQQQLKRTVTPQQSQAVLAATIAQQNALAATLAAQQAARAPASVPQGSFALAVPSVKKAALAPTTQAVNAVTERIVGAAGPASAGGMRAGGGAEWTPSGAPVALAASAPYDANAHTNATQLNQRGFGVEEGGGSAGGGKTKSRKRGDGQPMSVEELADEARTVAGMGAGELGIQSSAVDIWGLVSQRFQAHCTAGRLKDCR